MATMSQKTVMIKLRHDTLTIFWQLAAILIVKILSTNMTLNVLRQTTELYKGIKFVSEYPF